MLNKPGGTKKDLVIVFTIKTHGTGGFEFMNYLSDKCWYFWAQKLLEELIFPVVLSLLARLG